MQPRHFFTDAVEWFTRRNPEPGMISEAEHILIKAQMNHWAREGVCFALPAGGSFPMGEATAHDILGEGLLRPPYPVCILEYVTVGIDGVSGPNELKVIIVLRTVDDELRVNMMSSIIGPTGVWTPPAVQCTSNFGETTYVIRPCLPFYVQAKSQVWAEGRNFREDAMSIMETLALKTVYEFLYVVHNYHLTTEDVTVPERVNLKRAKRGRAPLLTYKVLTIGKKKRKSRHLGGTHASPRSHLRRGYYRTSRNGVRHWVQPCMVKGDTSGFVHKDYKVEGQSQCTL